MDFVLCDEEGNAPAQPTADDIITVFTTRADTLFGCSFFVLAPEYKGLQALVAGSEYEQPVMELVASCKEGERCGARPGRPREARRLHRPLCG